jgi:hypothetical protein
MYSQRLVLKNSHAFKLTRTKTTTAVFNGGGGGGLEGKGWGLVSIPPSPPPPPRGGKKGMTTVSTASGHVYSLPKTNGAGFLNNLWGARSRVGTGLS